ncbi:hypothetical protein CHUAL_008934 [Chamberlinius hualienensis]
MSSEPRPGTSKMSFDLRFESESQDEPQEDLGHHSPRISENESETEKIKRSLDIDNFIRKMEILINEVNCLNCEKTTIQKLKMLEFELMSKFVDIMTLDNLTAAENIDKSTLTKFFNETRLNELQSIRQRLMTRRCWMMDRLAAGNIFPSLKQSSPNEAQSLPPPKRFKFNHITTAMFQPPSNVGISSETGTDGIPTQPSMGISSETGTDGIPTQPSMKIPILMEGKYHMKAIIEPRIQPIPSPQNDGLDGNLKKLDYPHSQKLMNEFHGKFNLIEFRKNQLETTNAAL